MNKILEVKLVYNNEETKLYKIFMWLIGLLSNEEIKELVKSLNEYIEENKESD